MCHPALVAHMPKSSKVVAIDSSSEDLDTEKADPSPNDSPSSLPTWRRYLIVFVLAWVTLGSTFSSTSLLSINTQIAEDLDTSSEAINATTGGLLFLMGCSSFFWSPMSKAFGLRIAYNLCIITMLVLTVATALAPSFAFFAAMRTLSGLCGTFFHVSGQVILGDHFGPLERGRATGFLLSGTVLGPPLGPLFAAIIVEFTSWRVVLWTQAVIVGLGLILSLIVLPPRPAQVPKPSADVAKRPFAGFFGIINPWPTIKVMRYPNILFTHFSCGLLSWSQYFLLAAPGRLIAQKFDITSPLIAGLFYISPAMGFLAGSVIGGIFSDKTIKAWIVRRGNLRLPQDRLRSSLPSFFVTVPVGSLILGWTMQYADLERLSGGIALPIVIAFFIAFGLLAAFTSLNTYCAEAIPEKKGKVVAGKYLIQYTFAAAACASAEPLLDAVGVGLACTIGAIFVFIAGCLTALTSRKGLELQTWADRPSKPLTERVRPLFEIGHMSMP